MINSEITMVNCKDWFGLTDGDKTINIYTGFTIGTDKYNSSFTERWQKLCCRYVIKSQSAWKSS